MRRFLLIPMLLLPLGLTGCLAAAATGAVVGTAVGVTGAVVGTTAKVGKAAVGAAIPDGDDKEERREKKRR